MNHPKIFLIITKLSIIINLAFLLTEDFLIQLGLRVLVLTLRIRQTSYQRTSDEGFTSVGRELFVLFLIHGYLAVPEEWKGYRAVPPFLLYQLYETFLFENSRILPIHNDRNLGECL